MGNNSSNSSKSVQEFYTNIIQSAQSTCTTSCDEKTTGNVVVLLGSKADSVGITQKCTASTECTIANELSSVIENMATSRAQQSNDTTQSMLSFTFANVENSAEMEQLINNYVTQIMVASCQSTSDQLASDNIIFVKDSEVDTVVGISQSSDLKTQCVLNNLSKTSVQNTAVTETEQTNKIRSAFAMIIVAIAVILVIGLVLAAVVFFGMGGGGSVTGGLDQGKKDGGNKAASLLPLLL